MVLTELFTRTTEIDRNTKTSGVAHDGDLNRISLTGTAASASQLRVGLVDDYRFSQECVAKVFSDMSSLVQIRSFATVDEYTKCADADFDVTLYYCHATENLSADTQRILAGLRAESGLRPLIVMSDVDEAHQAAALRMAMSSGARGFIPTRTTGLSIMLAVIRFVRAGGTYAPLDLLLDEPVEVKPVALASGWDARGRFTARQMQVLALLQQGKANKNIAHELSMSESSVKVHIRNIMRLTGASNRTQAAYKLQTLDVTRGRGAGV